MNRNGTMVTAKCFRCYGSATGDTFEEASSLIDHAVGLSRGIPCGDNYNAVQEIVDENEINDTVDDGKTTQLGTITTETTTGTNQTSSTSSSPTSTVTTTGTNQTPDITDTSLENSTIDDLTDESSTPEDN